MIEAVIYATGVAALMSVFLVVIVLCVRALATKLVKKMCWKLGSVYRHAQLHFFMKELMEKGYAQCIEEIGTDDESKSQFAQGASFNEATDKGAEG